MAVPQGGTISGKTRIYRQAFMERTASEGRPYTGKTDYFEASCSLLPFRGESLGMGSFQM
jgi:hypothetical protein